MSLRRSSSIGGLTRRRSTLKGTEAPGNDTQPASEPRRVSLACQTCRKRKIRCDGNNPCANCARQGRQHCAYERVSYEENLAVKERKRQQALQKDKHKGGEGGTKAGRGRSASSTAKTEHSEEGSVDETPSSDIAASSSKEVVTNSVDETALSTRRHFNYTLPLNNGVGTASTSYGDTSLTPGLSAATFAFHLSDEPRTAPASMTVGSSYFGGSPAQLAVALPTPGPVSTLNPPPSLTRSAFVASESSPRARCASITTSPAPYHRPLPTPTASFSSRVEYPFTPPFENVHLHSPAPDAFLLETGAYPWHDALPSPRSTTFVLPHPPASHLIQTAPSSSWSLYDAIPAQVVPPLSTISPSVISPPTLPYDLPQYLSPYSTPSALPPASLPRQQNHYVQPSQPLPFVPTNHSYLSHPSSSSSSSGLQLTTGDEPLTASYAATDSTATSSSWTTDVEGDPVLLHHPTSTPKHVTSTAYGEQMQADWVVDEPQGPRGGGGGMEEGLPVW